MNDSPANILFITTGLQAGGAEAMLYRLISTIDRRLYRPHVLSLSDGGRIKPQIEAAGVPVYSLNLRPSIPDPRRLFQLTKLIVRINPSLIQGWMYHGNLAASAGAAVSRCRAPVAWGIRQSLDDIRKVKLTTAAVIRAGAAISKRPAAIVYCSKIAKLQHEALGFSPARSIFIPNGIDTGHFTPSRDYYLKLRSELDVAENTLIVAAIGRWHPQKDYRNFLAAAKIVAGRLSSIPVRFVLAGNGLDGSNNELADLIASLNLQNHLSLLGERNDAPALIGGLDLLVSSSSFGEAFPNVVAEAMSCAVPCVVTDIGDSAIIVGGCGAVVPPGSSEALAAEIERMLLLPTGERLKIGAAARSRIMAQYSLEQSAGMYEELFSRLLSGKPAVSQRNVSELNDVRDCWNS